MTRTRTRKAVTKPPAAPIEPVVKHVDISQPPMFVVRSLEAMELLLKTPSRIAGSYVKVAPTIRASERTAFDSAAIRASFVAAGAIAVVVAPSVVPDAHRPTAKVAPVTVSAEQHLRNWFADTKMPRELRERALEEAIGSAHEAGL